MCSPAAGRAGEGDLAYPRVGDERVAQHAAGADEHRQHALGQPRVDEALGERQRGQRGRAGRLEHDRVARGQRGCELVQHEQGRVVERRDGHHDSARLAEREADLVLAGAAVGVQRQGLAVELGALEGRQPDQLPGATGLAGGLGDGLARLGADRLRDLGGSLVGELRRPQQDPHPLVSRRTPPGPRRPARPRRRAASTSSGPATATVPTTEPSKGEVTSSRCPEPEAGRHRPPINISVRAIALPLQCCQATLGTFQVGPFQE